MASKIYIVPRIENETGKPALFFLANGELSCFTVAEMHCAASHGYFLQRTKPVDLWRLDVRRLVYRWRTLPGQNGCTAVLSRRLRQPAETAPRSILPVRPDVEFSTYHRPPTPSEMRFGHGATHYRDFHCSEFIKPDGSARRWITGDDGLRYFR